MKPWSKGVCRAAIAAGLFFSAMGTAFAHTMPEAEGTLILPMPPHWQFEIIPHQTTLDAIRGAMGADFKKTEFTGDGMRFVTYDYHGLFSFSARTGEADERDDGELRISGYSAKEVSLHTLSGFCVGVMYEDVVAKYGEADHVLRKESGLVSYIYDFAGRPTQLVFDVNDEGRIRAIHFFSEI